MDHVTLISGFSSRIADLVTQENSSLMVPSCPEWNLLDLALHLGEVHEFWTANIREGNTEHPWEGVRAEPEHSVNSISWCREQTKSLLAAMSEFSIDRPCWTWWEEPRTAGAIARHQVQEAAIHCWDAENAFGAAQPIPLDVARDGIAEYIHVHRFGIEYINVNGIKFREEGTENIWFINPDREIESTVTANASDLVLFLNGRLGLDDVKVDGELQGVQKFSSAAPELNS
jgi:uncharacterized protein (TIGR03083 family)